MMSDQCGCTMVVLVSRPLSTKQRDLRFTHINHISASHVLVHSLGCLGQRHDGDRGVSSSSRSCTCGRWTGAAGLTPVADGPSGIIDARFRRRRHTTHATMASVKGMTPPARATMNHTAHHGRAMTSPSALDWYSEGREAPPWPLTSRAAAAARACARGPADGAQPAPPRLGVNALGGEEAASDVARAIIPRTMGMPAARRA